MVKAAFAQVSPKPTPRESIEEAARLCLSLSRSEIDVLCLPEAWVSPKPPRSPEEATAVWREVIKAFGRVASELGAYVAPGAIHEARGDGLYVSTPILGPDGGLLGEQSKIHLFQGERLVFKPAARIEVFTLRGLKVGVMICYDAVFPEVARTLALRGADVILNPSRILAAGVEPWRLYLQARALENRVYVVGVNVAAPPSYPGRSLIVGLRRGEEGGVVSPVVEAEADVAPAWGAAELDLELARRLREERLSQRRKDLYRLGEG